jgi:hypothetical protein
MALPRHALVIAPLAMEPPTSSGELPTGSGAAA